MSKTVKEVLEEFLRKHYKDGLTSCVNIPYEDEAIKDLDALYKAKYLGMLPEEIEIPADVCGVKVTIAEAYGFNSAIQETKRRMNEHN